MKENRSVTRILTILKYISQHDEGVTLGQIYRELKMPKATVYDFLQTLYKADAIYYKDPRLKNYVIGSKMFEIGSVYTKNSNLIDAVEYEFKALAIQYGKTAFICKKTEGHLVYIYKFQPSSSLISPPEEIGTVIGDNEKHPIYQAFTIFAQDYDTLSKEEQLIYKRQAIISDFGSSGHISTIAVPVRNFENKITGVLALCDLVSDKENEEVIQKLILLAKQASKRLGYLGGANE